MADEEAVSVSRYRLELVATGEVPPLGREVSRPAQTLFLLRELLAGFDREVLGVLFLDLRNHLTGYTIAYVGTLHRMLAEPRGVFVPALLSNAAGVILFHNHPSGDPTPSPEDLAMTRRLRDAGDILGIRVVDHVILGSDGSYVSLRDRGELE